MLVEERSRITTKGQTTVPKAVRQALGVEAGDEIAFRIDEGGVTLRRAGTSESDPVLERFLAFLAQDMVGRPDALQAFPAALASRIEDLVGSMQGEPDEPIDGAVDL